MMKFENTEISMLIILLSSPLVVLAIHMILARIFHNQLPQIVAVKSILLGYLPIAVLLWKFSFYEISTVLEILSSIFYCFIVYTAFAYTYFHFFNMSETARRIRILHEIYKAGSLSSKDIMDLYRTSDIIDVRLKRLAAAKQLKYIDGYYYIHKKMLYFAALFIALWRNILGFTK